MTGQAMLKGFKRCGVTLLAAGALVGGTATLSHAAAPPAGGAPAPRIVQQVAHTSELFAGEVTLFDQATGERELTTQLTEGRLAYSPGSNEQAGTLTLVYKSADAGPVTLELKYTKYPVPPEPLWKLEGTMSVGSKAYEVEAWCEIDGPNDFAGDASLGDRKFNMDLATLQP